MRLREREFRGVLPSMYEGAHSIQITVNSVKEVIIEKDSWGLSYFLK